MLGGIHVEEEIEARSPAWLPDSHWPPCDLVGSQEPPAGPGTRVLGCSILRKGGGPATRLLETTAKSSVCISRAT